MKLTILVLLLGSTLWGQATSEPSASRSTANQAPAGDEFAQMRNDLNQMESLLGNMSSEIEFLHDQNLQILLRTNARMWTILIRDLRRQIDREERRSPASPGSQAPPAKPPSH